MNFHFMNMGALPSRLRVSPSTANKKNNNVENEEINNSEHDITKTSEFKVGDNIGFYASSFAMQYDNRPKHYAAFVL